MSNDKGNKEQKRKSPPPPEDVLQRITKAAKNAPGTPTVRTWADAIRQAWKDVRELVLKKNHAPADVAAVLSAEFGHAFDEDYIRRLLVAEARRRNDRRMLKALQCIDGAGNAVVRGAAKPKEHPSNGAPEPQPQNSQKEKRNARKGQKRKADPSEPASPGPQSELDLGAAGRKEVPSGEVKGRDPIHERLRRNHGDAAEPTA